MDYFSMPIFVVHFSKMLNNDLYFRSWVEPALSITFILTLLEVVVLLYGTVVTSLALGQEIEANLLALGLLTIFLWLGFLCKAIVFLMSVREVRTT